MSHLHAAHKLLARALQRLSAPDTVPYQQCLQAVRDCDDPAVTRRIDQAATKLALAGPAADADPAGPVQADRRSAMPRPQVLPCDGCGEPVEDLLKACAWLDEQDVRRARDAKRRIKEQTAAAGTGILTFTAQDLQDRTARWQLLHNACLEGVDAAHYTFGGMDLTTPTRALEQLCHMSTKPWVHDETDLVAFIRRLYPASLAYAA